MGAEVKDRVRITHRGPDGEEKAVIDSDASVGAEVSEPKVRTDSGPDVSEARRVP